MNINNEGGETISLSEAISFTHKYQDKHPSSAKAFYVSKNKLNEILNQEKCVGIRIYNGFDIAENKENRVLVGVDNQNEDLTEGIIIERLNVCPKYCPEDSKLIRSN